MKHRLIFVSLQADWTYWWCVKGRRVLNIRGYVAKDIQKLLGPAGTSAEQNWPKKSLIRKMARKMQKGSEKKDQDILEDLKPLSAA